MHRISFLRHMRRHIREMLVLINSQIAIITVVTIKTRRIYLQQVLASGKPLVQTSNIRRKSSTKGRQRDVHVTSNARCTGRAFNFLVRAVSDVRKTSLKVTDVVRAAYWFLDVADTRAHGYLHETAINFSFETKLRTEFNSLPTLWNKKKNNEVYVFILLLSPLNVPLSRQMGFSKTGCSQIAFQWYYPFGISKYASGMTHIISQYVITPCCSENAEIQRWCNSFTFHVWQIKAIHIV